MSASQIGRDDILRRTLFHIQLNQCQYIDNFPEAVADIFEEAIRDDGLSDYEQLQQRLDSLKTNFFDINRGHVDKDKFYRSLYERILRMAA